MAFGPAPVRPLSEAYTAYTLHDEERHDYLRNISEAGGLKLDTQLSFQGEFTPPSVLFKERCFSHMQPSVADFQGRVG
jgi:hypothetical protein